MRVQVVDPSAYTPPYDHALCAALSAAGAEVELVTSVFAYGQAPVDSTYAVRRRFYRHAAGAPGSRLRSLSKLAEHLPDMMAQRRHAQGADVVHFQWLPVQWVDRHLLPRRPVVLTAHDLLPREPRPLQARAQRRLYDAVDAVVTHSQYGRAQLVDALGVPAEKVRVIRHGAFEHLTAAGPGRLPAELGDPVAGPVVLYFGLVRPYKGVDVLLEAWRRVPAPAELWIVGRPRMETAGLRADAPARVRWVPRFVSDPELAACFEHADLVVLPYRRTERLDFSGVLATAMAFGRPAVLSDVGSFAEVAATGAGRLVPPGDPAALARALGELLQDEPGRARMAQAARAAAAGPYAWRTVAEQTLALYRDLTHRRDQDPVR